MIFDIFLVYDYIESTEVFSIVKAQRCTFVVCNQLKKRNTVIIMYVRTRERHVRHTEAEKDRDRDR